MSIRETNRRQRDRWPLEFDLEGIPRDNAERAQLLQQKQILEQSPNIEEIDQMSKITPVPNQFAADYQVANGVMDLNNPPSKRIPFQPFPAIVYHHSTGAVLTVNDAEELQNAKRHGYQEKPSPNHDYSQIRGGRAAAKASEPAPEEIAEDPAELDRAEAQASMEHEADQAERAEAPAEEEEPEQPTHRGRRR